MKKRRAKRGAALAVLVLLAAGCLKGPTYHYVIEMRPDGNEIERTLSGSGVSGRESQRLAALYDHLNEDRALVGQLQGKLPNDVGGAGSFTHFDTLMGSTSMYVERFGGKDDLGTQWTIWSETVDWLVDLLKGWLDAELAGEPGGDRLTAFIDAEFRNDLKNALMYAWQAGLLWEKDEELGEEFMVGAAQYFAERDYFDPRQLPQLKAAISYTETRDHTKPLMHFVLQLIAQRMGYEADEPVPAALAFLSDWERAKESLDRYLRPMPMYQGALAEEQAEDPRLIRRRLSMCCLTSLLIGWYLS